ncbi:efflux RND transporter periplasmic adaptor subunit [Thiocapsa sp.]|uniref:efflux RND transporter periplasmic adaptor subunit n=1 Tax=Thiocapsa sp. TaxID=2024551 RepID=UPI0025EB5105|nr:efflux RND transporter periplasmic adaptor subunit [Thiocapsa sp.]
MTRESTAPAEPIGLPSDSDRAAPPRRRLLRVALMALVLLGLAAGTSFWLTSRPENGISFETAEVERGDLRIKVTATGSLQPVNQVDVGTEVSGTIVRVAVDFNDRVETGQVLAELDPDQSRAKTRQSEAALALAEASVLEAQATVTETANKLRRTRDMIEKRLASPEELDSAVANAERALASLAVARAQVAQAQAELDANRRTLEKTLIRSPIDGIVLLRQVEPGQTVAASLQTPVLFNLAENLAQMELKVAIDEADVGQVAVGQSAEFVVDAYPDRRFPATIAQVRFAPETVSGVVTYAALLDLDNSDLALRPGMTATAEILVQASDDVVLVPNAALRFNPPQGAVPKRGASNLLGMLMPRPPATAKRPRVPEERSGKDAQAWISTDGEPTRVPVEVGASDGIMTQVLDDSLAPGTRVLVDVERKKP